MIFVRYHSTRAYRLYNPRMKDICISKDVVMNEAKMWDWSGKEDGSKHNVLITFKGEEEKSSDKYNGIG